jgi:hypothetical protein
LIENRLMRPGSARQRDVILAIFATPAALIAVTLAIVGVFDTLFWICAAVFALCFVLADIREAILAVPLLYASGRFVLWGIVFAKPLMIGAGATCLVGVLGLAILYKSRNPR